MAMMAHQEEQAILQTGVKWKAMVGNYKTEDHPYSKLTSIETPRETMDDLGRLTVSNLIPLLSSRTGRQSNFTNKLMHLYSKAVFNSSRQLAMPRIMLSKIRLLSRQTTIIQMRQPI